MRPRADALAVVHDEVQPRIACADLACEVDLGRKALSHDVRMPLHHGDLSRALEMPPVRDGIDAAIKDAPRIAFLCFFNQCPAQFRTECVAHDEQIASVKHDILAHGEVEIVVGDEEVARVEQGIHRADAALGEDAPDARLPQYPEHLPRGIRTRHAAAPAVHTAGQDAPSRNGEQAKRRALAIGRRKVQPIHENLHIIRRRCAREIARECPRAADHGIARRRNLLLCHTKTSVSRDSAYRAAPALCPHRVSDRSSS